MVKNLDIKLFKENPIIYAETLNTKKLVKLMEKLSEIYYNTGKSIISDDIYDNIKEILEKRDPDNNFLHNIGAPISSIRKKVTLPYTMGSLTKIKPDTEILKKWLNNYKGPYVLSDKLDGVSAQFYKDIYGKTFLYSRGNGILGQDISHLIQFIDKNIKIDMIPNETSIRGELIINKKDFTNISKDYENARNTASGLVNSKTVDKKLGKIIQFITYSIIYPRYTQEEQMEKLKLYNFKTVNYKVVKKLDEKILKNYLLERKEKSDFEMDGIVCADNSQIYEHKTGTPDNAFAFKMILENQIAEATVKKIIWNLSMDGYLIPTIEITPVKLVGTTITFATAFNAKYIVDNVIGPGSKIKIIRSGDVIPYILEVSSTSTTGKPQMPDCKYKWNETKINIITTEKNETIKVKLLIHFFKKMNVKYLSEGIITKLVDNGFNTIPKILLANHDELIDIDGIGKKLVDKIYEEIDRAFLEEELQVFMAATHAFGRGLGERKLVEIVKTFPYILTQKWTEKEMEEKITEIHGFNTKTAKLFTNNYKKFYALFTEINEIKDLSRFLIKEKDIKKNKIDNLDKIFTGKSLVFTGFRDKELEKFIVSNGGKVSTSVSSKTFIVIYADDLSSSKINKAKTLNITIMDKNDFIKKYKI